MPSLLELRLYKELNDFLKEVTEEDMDKIVPGQKSPDRVQYLGPMTPALKALLYLLNRSVIDYEECFSQIVKFGSTMTEEQVEKHRHELSELISFRTFIEEQFATALAFEYDLDPNENFGYDENLDVYVVPD